MSTRDSMKERFDRIDAELQKIRETTVAISTHSQRGDVTDKLRKLCSCMRDLVYPGIFDDLRSSGIGSPEQINCLEDACRELGFPRVQNWSRLEHK